MGEGLKRARAAAKATRRTPYDLAQPIKEAVSVLLQDKSIDRPTLIEAMEEAAADIDGVIDSLRDDERRAQSR